jgi:hypothetical protein
MFIWKAVEFLPDYTMSDSDDNNKGRERERERKKDLKV